jgi:hypothetical protein
VDFHRKIVLPDGSELPSLAELAKGLSGGIDVARVQRRDTYLYRMMNLSAPATAILAAETRQSMWKFAEVFWPIIDADDWMPAFYHKCLVHHFEYMSDFAQSDLVEMINNGPPRHGKSQLQNVLWMPWTWIEKPWTRWVFYSIADNIVMRDAGRSRDILNCELYKKLYGDVKLRTDSNSKTRYDNGHGGFRYSITIGSTNIGEGGDFLCIDDPEDPIKTKSAADREHLRLWFDGVFMRRANDPERTRKLLSQQRVGPDDLSSYVRSTRGWQNLIFPTEYEPTRVVNPRTHTGDMPKHAIVYTSLQQARPALQDGPAGSGRTHAGDLLWPEKHTRKAVDIRKQADPQTFARQDQQRPEATQMKLFNPHAAPKYEVGMSSVGEVVEITLIRPDGDGGIKRTTYPIGAWKFFQVGDTAFGTKKRNDRTAIGTFANGPRGEFLIWHFFVGHVPVPMQYEVFNMLARYPGAWDKAAGVVVRRGSGWPMPLVYRAVEKKGTGIGIVQEAALEGNPLHAVDPGKEDKETRAADAANLYRIGGVYHPANPQEWYADYCDEMDGFPGGAHDDMVDCVAYGVRLARRELLIRSSINLDDPDSPYHVNVKEEIVPLVNAPGGLPREAIQGEDFEYFQLSDGQVVKVDVSDPLERYFMDEQNR